MDYPLISVIVPVYNTGLYLSDCIQSILLQNYKNLELILVDDGSEDNSLEICRQFADIDKRITVMTQTNQGQSMARNKGLNNAHGEYIMFVDSDDAIMPQAVETLYRAVVDYDADFAFAGTVFSNGIRETIFNPYTEARCFSAEELLIEYASTSNMQSVIWNKLYSRKLFSEIRFPDARKNEDVCVLLQLIGKTKRAVYINKLLYKQNIRFGSVEKARFSKNQLLLIEAEEQTAIFYKSSYPELYSLVIGRKADAIALVIGKIFEDYAFILYRELLIELYKKLKFEYMSVCNSGLMPRGFNKTSPAYQIMTKPIRFCFGRLGVGLKKWALLYCGFLIRKLSIRKK